jgi:hypothetical protein
MNEDAKKEKILPWDLMRMMTKVMRNENRVCIWGSSIYSKMITMTMMTRKKEKRLER